jgi:prevent-host-death family protein
MRSINALAVRRRLGEILDDVAEGGDPLLVTRGNRPLGVLVPAAQYEQAAGTRHQPGGMRQAWLRGRHTFGQVLIAAALGRNDDAIALLQRAFAEYYPFSASLHVEPTFAALKNDPRWMALVTAR